jgi:hypothetical protein
MDEEIDLNTKRMMLQALNKPGISSPEPKYMMEEDEDIGNKTLADFVTSSRMMFFEKLRLDHSFLEVDPMNWATRNDYQTVKKYLNKMYIVNDNAERAVALMQSYNNHLTKNEEQMQYILQVVEIHRKKSTKVAKSDLKRHI